MTGEGGRVTPESGWGFWLLMLITVSENETIIRPLALNVHDLRVLLKLGHTKEKGRVDAPSLEHKDPGGSSFSA